ncbi:MAG TPA: CoA-binding protein, partial [Hyphomicrobiaceae bacterium]|nr:CoA-binding protein [Hyphomicrobiaceae bacterium]
MSPRRPDLTKLLAPRSVAVVGAAPIGQGIRGRALEVLRMHAFAGAVHPVSRSLAEVQGLKAYPSVAALPETPELAVLVIPAANVPDELERCGKAGVGAAVVISSGFAEEAGEAGRASQQRLRAIADRYGMALLGPNSEGFATLGAKLCVTFSPAVADTSLPLIPEGKRGRIAVVAQSGGMGFAFYDRGRPKGLAFSHVVTTGNEAQLEVFDVVEHLIDRDEADVFLLLVEDVKTAATFVRAGRKAQAAGKPIIAVKIGKSDAGQRAAKSHTAALAGSYAAFSAMARSLGMIEAHELDEAVDLAQAFLAWRQLPPKGRRVAICTASGGGGGWLADASSAAGLEVPL